MAARGNGAAAADYELFDKAGKVILDPRPKRPGPREVKNLKVGEIELVSKAKLPTRFGIFTIYGFLDHRDDKEHTAMVHGEVRGARACPVRVHSECHTGDIWFSLRCDCREQLEASLNYINSQERGAVIYLRQEGRGIGLLNKLKAYELQDAGMDTVEANRHLGFPADRRDYSLAGSALRFLGLTSVRLLSNNPDKVTALERAGIRVVERIPCQPAPARGNRSYLRVKKEKLGHLLAL